MRLRTVSLRTGDGVGPWMSCFSTRSSNAVQLAPYVGWARIAYTNVFASRNTAAPAWIDVNVIHHPLPRSGCQGQEDSRGLPGSLSTGSIRAVAARRSRAD